MVFVYVKARQAFIAVSGYCKIVVGYCKILTPRRTGGLFFQP